MARSKFGDPMFELEAFRKEIYCIEESTCEIVETFRRHKQTFGAPAVIQRPGNWPPVPPVVTPLFSTTTYKIRRVRVEEYAYYVNKLHQNVCLET